jgi:hypothetical protein
MPVLLKEDDAKTAAETTIKAAQSEAPGHENVYFLGPYARRVGFASQQNRALNLVWALTRMGHIEPGNKIAVVGAGLSGVTTAIALKHEGYDLCLIEQTDQVLHRQFFSNHRFIHPTINEWPDKTECLPTTQLPYFDWMSDICSRVIGSLNSEWKQLAQKYGIEPCLNSKIIGIEKRGRGTLLAFCQKGSNEVDKDHPLAKEPFDVVIVTSGFGDEDVEKYKFLQTYWRNENLEDFLKDEKQRFVVSGCGDGGLIDTLRIVHRDFAYGELVVEVVNRLRHHAGWEHAEKIRLAEKAAAENPARRESYVDNGSKELADVYGKAAAELPPDIADILKVSLRNKFELVQLVCPEEWPYSPLAAPIHKLLVTHAMLDDVVKHVRGKVQRRIQEFEVRVKPPGKKQKAILVEGKVVIRHGARPNFERILNNDTAFKKLRDMQLDIAENLDRALWARSELPLYEWPPERPDGKYDLELLKNRRNRAMPLWMKLIRVGLRLRTDEIDGFRVEPDTGAVPIDASEEERLEQQDMVASLPSSLFGIALRHHPPAANPEDSTAQSLTTASRGQSTYTTLFPGMPITILSNRRSDDDKYVTVAKADGRLGPFVRDAAGRRFALTVGHLLPLVGPDEPTWIEAGGYNIGAIQYEQLPDHPYYSEAASLSRFEIGADLRTTNAYGPEGYIDDVAQQDFIFGEKVFMYLPNGDVRTGYVSSTATTVKFRNPNTRRDDVFTGVVRVRSLRKSEFSKHGDSGAPVVSEKGALVGLVLSGAGGLSYVAPVWRYLEQHKLTLDTRGTVPWSTAIESEGPAERNLLREVGRMSRRAALEFETDPFDRTRPVPADDGCE